MGDTKDGSWTSRELGAYLRKNDAEFEKWWREYVQNYSDSDLSYWVKFTAFEAWEGRRRVCLCESRDGLQELKELREKFPVSEQWGHEKLVNVLEGAAGLLEVIKTEWAEEWSEWDQSVRNGITLQLAALIFTAHESKEGWNKEREHFELCWCSNPSFMLEPIPTDLDALKEFSWHVWQHAVSSAKRRQS